MDSNKPDEKLTAKQVEEEWRAKRLQRKIAATDNLPVRNMRWLEPPKPIDWPHWRRQTEVMLREAVFLSFEINPEIEEHYSDFIENTHRDWQTAIYKRLRTLRGSLSDLNHFAPGTKMNTADPNKCGVRLPEFAAWCINVGYEIPPELAAMAQSPGAGTNPVGGGAGDLVTPAPAEPVQGTARVRPQSQHRHQENEILRVIGELGFDAKALPKVKHGTRGAKYEVRNKLTFSAKVFDLAWERLRNTDDIQGG